MTIILIPKSDDNIDRQMPIFHEHTSDFDDWWCKSGFADVDNLIFFRRPKKRVRFDESKNEIWTIDRYDDKENERSRLNISISDDENFQSAEMKIMYSNDDEGSSSINSDITTENEKVDSTRPHIACDEDTGRKNRTRRETILKAAGKFRRRLSENFWRRIVNGISRLFSCSLGQQRKC